MLINPFYCQNDMNVKLCEYYKIINILRIKHHVFILDLQKDTITKMSKPSRVNSLQINISFQNKKEQRLHLRLDYRIIIFQALVLNGDAYSTP